jgi:hypothetical protein
VTLHRTQIRSYHLSRPPTIKTYSHLLALAILLVGFLVYAYRINEWYMHDDEGGYDYAAWRISQGEVPYRDFLTPQLPLFLYGGGLLVRVAGPSALALRYATVVTTLLAAWLAYLSVNEVFGYQVALLSLPLWLLHKDVYFIARFFRPEAYMLLFTTAGMYALVRAYPERRWRGALVSGGLFGLAMLCKLFAALPYGGCVLFLLYDWWRTRDERVVEQLLAIVAGFVAVAGTVFMAFQVATPYFLTAVLGHHAMQGAELSRAAVAAKALRFFGDYLRGNPLFLVLAVVGAVRSFRQQSTLRRFFLWQLPTLAAFVVLSRELQDRHLVYLVPALAALSALALERLLAAEPSERTTVFQRAMERLGIWPRRAVVLILVVLTLLPSLRVDLAIAAWDEDDTAPLAHYVQNHTAPDDHVLSDYPGLNFHAQRANTYWGAGLSGGATSSGQITGQLLIEDIEANDVQMVLINTAGSAHQLVNLHDYAAFRRYVQEHFSLVRLFQRSYQTFEVYHRQDLLPLLSDDDFGAQLSLTGADLGPAEVEAGSAVPVTLRWQAQTPLERDYTLSLRLVDAAGQVYGQHDQPLAKRFTSGWSGVREIIDTALTSRWDSGESVLGEYALSALPGTPPGTYQLTALLYHLDSGQVLPVLDAEGDSTGTQQVLGSIHVAKPGTPPDSDDLDLAAPLMADLGGQLMLLGRGPLPERARPGDTVSVLLFWQAQRAMDRDWRLQLQVKAEEGSTWAAGTLEPATAQHPTTQWAPGEVVRGQYDLHLDVNAAGAARIVLNLIDRDSGWRLLAADLPLGELQIEGRKRVFDLPRNMQHSLNANLSDQVTLLGYELRPTSLSPGKDLHLTLYWQAQGTMQTGYTVFTHLLGPDEQLWGQQDNVPVQGTYPTTAWLPGEVVEDQYTIEVVPDAPSAQCVLEVGMYDAATGERLAVLDSNRQPVGNRVLLPGVLIKP